MINKEEGTTQTTGDLFFGTPAEDKATGVVVEEKQDEPAKADFLADGNKETESPVDKAESEESEDKSKTDDANQETELSEADLKFKAEDVTKEELAEVLAKAKELSLNKDQAQAFLDLKQTAQDKVYQDISTQVDNLKKGWLEASKADKDYGGAKLAESAELSKRFMDKFGDDELKQIFDQEGHSNRLAFLRAFAKAGKALADDKFIPGNNTPAPQEKATYDSFYEQKI